MDKIKFREIVSKQLRNSRWQADLTQSDMAKKLNVSLRTVHNWESGYSTPLVEQIFEWFEVLKIQPQPYIIQLLHAEHFNKPDTKFNDKDVDDALMALLPDMSIETKRKMLYLFYGSHGSSPESVIDMITAHLHTDLRYRINVAETIITNYEIADAKNEVIEPNHIRPDLVKLKKATSNARDAILKNKKSYYNI